MRSVPRLLPLFLALACATPSTPFEGHPVLVAIKFEGNRSISSKDLEEHIATAPTSGYFSRTARYYDADLFTIDQKRLLRWYNAKGFYEAQIRGVDEIRDGEGRVTLLVHIDEGRRAIVRKLDFKGVQLLRKDELDSINDSLLIHPGDGFDESSYEKSKELFLDGLKEHGFAAATVSGAVRVKPEDGEAEIALTAETGPRYSFGKVNVTGNRAIPADQIAQATGISEGDQFSPLALELAQQHVYNLGTFSGVRVSLEPLGDTPVAAVRVNVREAPFQTVRFGVGGQIEERRWELPRLRAEYTNRSLFGGLRRLELASNVGYAFVPSIVSFDKDSSGIVTQSSAQLTVPNFYYPGLDAVSRAEFAREFQSGFSYDQVAARFALVYRRGRHSISPSINFVRYFSIRIHTGLSQVLSQAGGKIGIFRDCPDSCTLTYPELRYTYDARDNVIETTEGFYATVDLQQTLKPGSFTYFRIEPEVRFYRPLHRFLTLATRAQYGGLFTEGGTDASPFTQRFFGGGQTYQRGYAPLQQGPKLGSKPNADTLYATDAVPIGGKSAILLSAELRLRADYLLNHLGFVAFVDASRIGNDPKQPWSGGLEIAPGLGLRYITAFGPIRLDVAYLVNPRDVIAQSSSDTAGNIVVKDTPVSASCNSSTNLCVHQSRLAYHLTLGEAF